MSELRLYNSDSEKSLNLYIDNENQKDVSVLLPTQSGTILTNTNVVQILTDNTDDSFVKFIRKPSAPKPISGTGDLKNYDGYFEVGEYITTPTYVGEHQYTEWIASTDVNFNKIVSSYRSNNVFKSTWRPRINLVSTKVYIKYRFVSGLQISEWSEVTEFTTPNTMICMPAITISYPNNNTVKPMFTLDGFKVLGDIEYKHVYTNWVIKDINGNILKDPIHSNDVNQSLKDLTNLLSYNVPVEMGSGTEYVIEVSFGLDNGEETETTKAIFVTGVPYIKDPDIVLEFNGLKTYIVGKPFEIVDGVDEHNYTIWSVIDSKGNYLLENHITYPGDRLPDGRSRANILDVSDLIEDSGNYTIECEYVGKKFNTGFNIGNMKAYKSIKSVKDMLIPKIEAIDIAGTIRTSDEGLPILTVDKFREVNNRDIVEFTNIEVWNTRTKRKIYEKSIPTSVADDGSDITFDFDLLTSMAPIGTDIKDIDKNYKFKVHKKGKKATTNIIEFDWVLNVDVTPGKTYNFTYDKEFGTFMYYSVPYKYMKYHPDIEDNIEAIHLSLININSKNAINIEKHTINVYINNDKISEREICVSKFPEDGYPGYSIYTVNDEKLNNIKSGDVGYIEFITHTNWFIKTIDKIPFVVPALPDSYFEDGFKFYILPTMYVEPNIRQKKYIDPDWYSDINLVTIRIKFPYLDKNINEVPTAFRIYARNDALDINGDTKFNENKAGRIQQNINTYMSLIEYNNAHSGYKFTSTDVPNNYDLTNIHNQTSFRYAIYKALTGTAEIPLTEYTNYFAIPLSPHMLKDCGSKTDVVVELETSHRIFRGSIKSPVIKICNNTSYAKPHISNINGDIALYSSLDIWFPTIETISNKYHDRYAISPSSTEFYSRYYEKDMNNKRKSNEKWKIHPIYYYIYLLQTKQNMHINTTINIHRHKNQSSNVIYDDVMDIISIYDDVFKNTTNETIYKEQYINTIITHLLLDKPVQAGHHSGNQVENYDHISRIYNRFISIPIEEIDYPEDIDSKEYIDYRPLLHVYISLNDNDGNSYTVANNVLEYAKPIPQHTYSSIRKSNSTSKDKYKYMSIDLDTLSTYHYFKEILIRRNPSGYFRFISDVTMPRPNSPKAPNYHGLNLPDPINTSDSYFAGEWGDETNFKRLSGDTAITGAAGHYAYEKGDRISYKGKYYECLVDQPWGTYNPSTEPTKWKEIKNNDHRLTLPNYRCLIRELGLPIYENTYLRSKLSLNLHPDVTMSDLAKIWTMLHKHSAMTLDPTIIKNDTVNKLDLMYHYGTRAELNTPYNIINHNTEFTNTSNGIPVNHPMSKIIPHPITTKFKYKTRYTDKYTQDTIRLPIYTHNNTNEIYDYITMISPDTNKLIYITHLPIMELNIPGKERSGPSAAEVANLKEGLYKGDIQTLRHKGQLYYVRVPTKNEIEYAVSLGLFPFNYNEDKIHISSYPEIGRFSVYTRSGTVTDNELVSNCFIEGKLYIVLTPIHEDAGPYRRLSYDVNRVGIPQEVYNSDTNKNSLKYYEEIDTGFITKVNANKYPNTLKYDLITNKLIPPGFPSKFIKYSEIPVSSAVKDKLENWLVFYHHGYIKMIPETFTGVVHKFETNTIDDHTHKMQHELMRKARFNFYHPESPNTCIQMSDNNTLGYIRHMSITGRYTTIFNRYTHRPGEPAQLMVFPLDNIKNDINKPHPNDDIIKQHPGFISFLKKYQTSTSISNPNYNTTFPYKGQMTVIDKDFFSYTSGLRSTEFMWRPDIVTMYKRTVNSLHSDLNLYHLAARITPMTQDTQNPHNLFSSRWYNIHFNFDGHYKNLPYINNTHPNISLSSTCGLYRSGDIISVQHPIQAASETVAGDFAIVLNIGSYLTKNIKGTDTSYVYGHIAHSSNISIGSTIWTCRNPKSELYTNLMISEGFENSNLNINGEGYRSSFHNNPYYTSIETSWSDRDWRWRYVTRPVITLDITHDKLQLPPGCIVAKAGNKIDLNNNYYNLWLEYKEDVEYEYIYRGRFTTYQTQDTSIDIIENTNADITTIHPYDDIEGHPFSERTGIPIKILFDLIDDIGYGDSDTYSRVERVRIFKERFKLHMGIDYDNYVIKFTDGTSETLSKYIPDNHLIGYLSLMPRSGGKTKGHILTTPAKRDMAILDCRRTFLSRIIYNGVGVVTGNKLHSENLGFYSIHLGWKLLEFAKKHGVRRVYCIKPTSDGYESIDTAINIAKNINGFTYTVNCLGHTPDMIYC